LFDHLAAEEARLVPECHPLHYFQMATEKLAKAAFLALGQPFDAFSHVAFSHLPTLLARRDVAMALGYHRFDAFRSFLSRSAPLFRKVDELNPAVGLPTPGGGPKDGPNVEYPWQARDAAGAVTWIVPAEYDFGFLDKLLRSGDAARMLAFVRVLVERFEPIFGPR
jgi:hypothetical protein